MTLIIYDTTGRILVNQGGTYVTPVGVPFLEVDIPDLKYPISVDVTTTPHTVVYADIPKSQELTRIEYLEGVVNALIGF